MLSKEELSDKDVQELQGIAQENGVSFGKNADKETLISVSYTHLTLPTILLV